MSGIERIAKERQRQIDVEGWTPEHDDEYKLSELLLAAVCYAEGVIYDEWIQHGVVHPSWPLTEKWWRPSADPIRNLEKAGALIAAEIDRLEREHADSPED